MTQTKRQKEKKEPIRTCIATREKCPKKDLVRIVLDPETNKLEVDLRNKIRARGANLLPTLEAFELMEKKKVLRRALKLDRAITQDEYKELREKFIEAIEEKNFRPNNKPVKVRVKNNTLTT
ncbi:YlxR family protein [Candidatus Dojkabacteria bacterium]|uniref:YlxR family protein n=1 Tax=Candidatus Dojkabacteria bacterium TaxID=2099670 RepID=A0A955L9W4_9BACT|nr:YlxR family protein [Candidatus Dojkabacteria bacterium]